MTPHRALRAFLADRAIHAGFLAFVAIVFFVGAPAVAQAAPSAAAPVLAWQTAAGGRMEFEVASVRPAAPGASGRTNVEMGLEEGIVPADGRFSATGALSAYIKFAYRLSVFQNQADFSHVPKWVTTELFDIEAKAPAADATKDQLRMMMQSLLTDRFKLAAHFETRDVPVMALVLVKPGKVGPRLRPHSEGPACDAKIPPVDRNSPKIPDVFMPVCNVLNLLDWANHTVILGSRNTTMDIFADWFPALERFDRPVVNQTGLTGRFDIELNFTPYWVIPKEQGGDAQLDFTGPTFFDALKGQLGMRLVSTHAPVETLVVDHVEQPSPN